MEDLDWSKTDGVYPQLGDDQEFVNPPVPECIQMIPGIPFAYELNGDPEQLHTVGAVHTFESLRHEPDFWDIYEDTVIVVKGLRGCRPVGNTDQVFPITDFNLWTNDRSPKNLLEGSKAGSFNLASTLLKGVGPGIVLPAAQDDSAAFRAQSSTVLKALARLQRRVLRKSVSKF
ncbi:hypothetical protein C8J57DRAFT_1737563 [Mycena rebaudengoi]|nr:hypothetical protein C8J57DRAFT_1737563 [Mycena rebaudengoi]